MKTTRAGDRAMMLRLALVGIVAALGVTLPSQTECNTWLITAETWASSFFADWDTWRPRELGAHHGLDSTADHECEQCRLARLDLPVDAGAQVGLVAVESASSAVSAPPAVTGDPAELPHEPAPAPPSRTSWVAVEPIAVNDEHAAGARFEPSGSDEMIGIALAPAPRPTCRAREEWAAVASNLAPALLSERWGPLSDGRADLGPIAALGRPDVKIAPASIEPIVATDDDLHDQPLAPDDAPAALADVVELAAPVAEPSAAADVPDFFEPVACALYPPQADGLMSATDRDSRLQAAADGLDDACDLESPNSGAEAKLLAAVAAAKITTSPEEQAAALPWPVFSAVEPVAETASTTTAVPEITVPWPTFAPAVAAAEPETAIAVKSSRPAEESAVGPSAPACPIASDESSAPSPQPSGWNQAVRLTGQAMSAWVGVLTGVARVEVTAR